MKQRYEWPERHGPVYRLTDSPGLPLTSGERARFLRLARERGHAVSLTPAEGAMDVRGRRVIVLAYRALHDTCVFFKPFSPADPRWIVGPSGQPGGACTIYEERPLACRAFPLKPMGRELAVCVDCPEVVDAGESLAETREAYGDIVDAANDFAREPVHQTRILEFLRVAGKIEPLAGPQNAEALRIAGGWPRDDLEEMLAREGLVCTP